ncbi:hypothetical protein KC343_g8117 [Hortaea werneckii]|uniref:Uncharacterized protein n=1 Tax=Hortaea werneckii TaxID=91943 RepID=A0A3M7DKA1_HORWE|nr:hypothetical protein KC352_g16053 [Hortaea werneckii]KAI7562323.1 hypothetical protein KC317_g8485 [Hortaea werneckii]KAI7611926.1 hypothetical protein KC346_g8070 [Hortaea werneckii]KAI7621201.1 hypothetical protein KC343_g8117 [Hortaea werneckii]KAI7662881.1 hypothetical protein KC319_g7949 [Hortaea werneckii]
MATESNNDLNANTYLFNQLDSYPWDEDQEFQGGLQAILGSVQDPAQVEHLTLRAKCYFYARKAGTHVDFDGYKRWVENGHSVPNAGSSLNGNHVSTPQAPAPIDSLEDTEGTQSQSDGGMGNAPKPASFAELVDMIAEGKPIPGIKDIPDTILEGQASESQKSERKKPWEKEPGQAQTPSWLR